MSAMTSHAQVEALDFMEWLNAKFDGLSNRLDEIADRLETVQQQTDRVEKLILSDLPVSIHIS